MIKLHDPKIRNDLLMLLGSQTYETISTRGRQGDAAQDGAGDGREGRRATKAARPKKVEQLYFTSFVMQ